MTPRTQAIPCTPHEPRTIIDCNKLRESCGRWRVLPILGVGAAFFLCAITWGVTLGQEVTENRKDIENISSNLEHMRTEQQVYFERVIKILERSKE